MNMYFPQFRVLGMAENTTHNMHNLYTLRGAEILLSQDHWLRSAGRRLTRAEHPKSAKTGVAIGE